MNDSEPSRLAVFVKALFNPRFLLKLAVSSLLLAYILSKVEIREIFNSIAQIPAGYVIGALFLNLFAVAVVQSLQILSSLNTSYISHLGSLAKINLSVMFYSLFLPTALVALLRFRKYKRAGLKALESATLVVFHRILQVFVAASFLLIGILFTRHDLGPYRDRMLFPAVVVFLLSFIFMYVFLVSRGATTLEIALRPAFSLTEKFPTCRKLLEELLRSCKQFTVLNRKNKLLIVIFGSAVQVLIILAMCLVVFPFNQDIGFLEIALVRSVVVVLTVLPIAIAGMGVRDLSFYLLLPLFGMDPTASVAVSFILLGIHIMLGLIGGIVELLFPEPARLFEEE